MLPNLHQHLTMATRRTYINKCHAEIAPSEKKRNILANQTLDSIRSVKKKIIM